MQPTLDDARAIPGRPGQWHSPVLVTLMAARTRWGWVAAVSYSVVVSPRLLIYMFSTILAVLRRPTDREPRGGSYLPC